LRFIDQFERKHPRFGIPNLIVHLIILTAIVSVLDLLVVNATVTFSSLLALNSSLVLRGQVWRLITFMFVYAGGSNPLYLILYAMFTFMIGRNLEGLWGTCRFTLYYIVSMLATIAASFIVPSAFFTGMYINLSLFIAYAVYFPNNQILFMFIIPLKVKYLLYIELAFLAITVIQCLQIGDWGTILSILTSLLAPALFFGGDGVQSVKAFIRRQKYKRKFK